MDRTTHVDLLDNGNQLPPPECANNLSENAQILRNSGWLCGFRVDQINRPQVSPHQIASYVDGAVPFIEETNEIRTEVIASHTKRESNYVHHGWSENAIATISPWTSSRIGATNQRNAEGDWVTRRTLVARLRIQVLLQDLTPTPEFVAVIEEALTLPTRFEKFQAIYRALSRWGDVLPLEIEIGSSLTLTDTEVNFSQFPPALYNNLAHLSTIKTANMIRKGAASGVGWNDGSWTTLDIPATEWRPITVVTVAPTISLLSDSLQKQLSELYAERLSYAPPLTIKPLVPQRKIYDDTNISSRMISQVSVRFGACIDRLSVTYLDGVISRGGGEGGAEYAPFILENGEYITEMLTCGDGTWLRGIQFITNTGRCSAIYGRLEGVPTIVRSKGGILAGFSVRTGVNTHGSESIHEVWGIWRYDYTPSVSKQNDVYSDYFGVKPKYGIGFNDRPVVRNSTSMHISSVEIRAGAGIDSIQFTYRDTRNNQHDKLRTMRHGGSGGNPRQFELGDGEYIVSISGKYNEKEITQLSFGTNLGRMSEVYGEAPGQSFTAQAPTDENGTQMRLHYVLGKSDIMLNGIMFVWTPDLS